MCGLLGGRGHLVVLTGDASLSARPMDRIVEPLTMMGARIESRSGKAPLVILPACTASNTSSRWRLPRSRAGSFLPA